ncbi:hypothetical protein [Streptomyces silvensis]|uniref:hypothetical protein n=1 Tax=Streptomyces silvensis TaxID=1765722 RepID=UPI000A764052|nr:hypothetical protein [Streptomyces silvensis]
MKRTPNDDAVRDAFDRFHATASTNRRAAVEQLQADMKRAGGPVPANEDEET